MRLARLIGPARAKEILFTGEMIDDRAGARVGTRERVVEDGTALDGARELAATIAARGPMSNRLAKELVDAAQDLPLDAALSLSTGAQQRIFDSSDLHEGVRAFFAKRDRGIQGTIGSAQAWKRSRRTKRRDWYRTATPS